MTFTQEEARNKLVEAGCVPAQADVIMLAIDESRAGFATMDETQTLLKNLETLSDGQARIWAELETLRDGQVAIRADVNTIRTDVNAIRTDMTKMQIGQAEFLGAMNTNFAELSGLLIARFEKFAGELKNDSDRRADRMDVRFEKLQKDLFVSMWKAIGAALVAGAAVIGVIMAIA